jgi:uncharacterized protein
VFAILQIKSAFLSVEIRAPKKGAASAKHPESVTFNVVASSGLATALWSADGKSFVSLSESTQRPFFVEDTQYRIHVKSLVPGHAPVLLHRDPLLFGDVDTYPEDGTCSGVINFHRQVGVCTLSISVGDQSLDLTCEIFPSKLDYATDYKWLLGEVSGFSRGLALEYMRSTYHRGRAESVDQPSATIEWLILLQAQLGALQSALDYINAHPKRQLVRTSSHQRVDSIRKIDSATRRSIVNGSGRGEFINVPGVGHIRERIYSSTCIESVDTPEHRWLRASLRSITLRLAEIHAAMESDLRAIADRQTSVPKRLQAEERELGAAIVNLNRLINLPALSASHAQPSPGFSSLTLLSGAGYAQAYRAILTLQLGLNTNDGDFTFSVSDVHQLYEVWCFIKVVNFVLQACGGPVDVSAVVGTEERGVRIRLKAGHEIAIADASHERTIVITYNQTFDGPTGNQKPDITITFKQSGRRDLILVLDAKYRVDRTSEYIKRFGIIGPPIDAVNALHRYRDAIFLEVENSSKLRPVIKGVALFPASESECTSLKTSPLYNSIGSLGIGALPFLPGNTQHFQDWLVQILGRDFAGLSDHGPMFSGWENQGKAAMPNP